MAKKFTSLIGYSKEDFDELVRDKEVFVRPARLIPVSKPGDESPLTSVLLASLRLIREFRNSVWKDVKMSSGGKVFVYTEVAFPKFPDCRVDGLILVVKSGVIRDAAILEMKCGSSELEVSQVEKYLQLAKTFSIPKLITVSNQFVSEPTQFPLDIKIPKEVEVFHLSWSYLLTLAHILLFDNDEINIADDDQIEIMREVVQYLEFEKSGVSGFRQMKKGWTSVVDKINSGSRVKPDDQDTFEAVLSWHQEERDLALMLSRHLGVLVSSGNPKYRDNLKERLEADKRSLVERNLLSGVLRIKDAVSDIQIEAKIEKRAVEMIVRLKAPVVKTAKGQIGWLRKQMEFCEKRNPALFGKISEELFIEIHVKSARNPDRMRHCALDDFVDDLKGKEVKEFRIILLKDFGKTFSSRTKFVEIVEEMAEQFYSGVVQHLRRWEPIAPKMPVATAGGGAPNAKMVVSITASSAVPVAFDAEREAVSDDDMKEALIQSVPVRS